MIACVNHCILFWKFARFSHIKSLPVQLDVDEGAQFFKSCLTNKQGEGE